MGDSSSDGEGSPPGLHWIGLLPTSHVPSTESKCQPPWEKENYGEIIFNLVRTTGVSIGVYLLVPQQGWFSGYKGPPNWASLCINQHCVADRNFSQSTVPVCSLLKYQNLKTAAKTSLSCNKTLKKRKFSWERRNLSKFHRIMVVAFTWEASTDGTLWNTRGFFKSEFIHSSGSYRIVEFAHLGPTHKHSWDGTATDSYNEAAKLWKAYCSCMFAPPRPEVLTSGGTAAGMEEGSSQGS